MKLPLVKFVRVSFGRDRNDVAPDIVMSLVTTYPDLPALEEAIKGPQLERAEAVFEAVSNCLDVTERTDRIGATVLFGWRRVFAANPVFELCTECMAGWNSQLLFAQTKCSISWP